MDNKVIHNHLGSVTNIIAVSNKENDRIRLMCSYRVSEYAVNQLAERACKSVQVWDIDAEVLSGDFIQDQPYVLKNVKDGNIRSRSWDGHQSAISSVLISRVSKNRLFTGSHDATIQVRDVQVL